MREDRFVRACQIDECHLSSLDLLQQLKIVQEKFDRFFEEDRPMFDREKRPAFGRENRPIFDRKESPSRYITSTWISEIPNTAETRFFS